MSTVDRIVDIKKAGEINDSIESNDNLDNELGEISSNKAKVLPQKFAGKSAEEIANSYTELEKELGRKANEVGELRKLTDQYLQLELSRNNQTSETKLEVEEEDFFDDPLAAVNRQLDKNPRIRELERKLEDAQRKTSQEAFELKHPDLTEIVSDADFMQWVGGSKVRNDMFAKANNYDFDTADELLSSWKERKQLIEAADLTKQAKEKTQKDFQAISSERGSSGESSKKIYRRADIMRLRLENPSKYKSMWPEFRKAYEEGNVK